MAPQIRAGRAWLDVPFSDKVAAKALGARYDPAARRWYAPRPGLPTFARWAPVPEILPGEDRSYGTGLYADPIPSTSWFENVRSAVSPQDWDRLRHMVYRRAVGRCEACGARPDREAGLFLEAHERFAYDETAGIQVLRRLICLCTPCHATTHYGLASKRGRGDQALTHLCAVTGMPEAEAIRHLEAAFALWEQRSRIRWELDLSILAGAGVGVVKPSGSAMGRAEWAPARRQGGLAAARIRTRPDEDPAARPRPVPMGSRPRPAGLGSRWERWLTTGER
jgi:Domain of unknown function (DUF5710)